MRKTGGSVIYKAIKTCDTPELRQEGMQGLLFEHDNECCVFAYESRHPLRFWGKGCDQDMWVSCIDDGVVTCCRRIYAGDETPVVLPGKGSMAIETPTRLYVDSVVTIDGDTVIIDRP